MPGSVLTTLLQLLLLNIQQTVITSGEFQNEKHTTFSNTKDALTYEKDQQLSEKLKLSENSNTSEELMQFIKTLQEKIDWLENNVTNMSIVLKDKLVENDNLTISNQKLEDKMIHLSNSVTDNNKLLKTTLEKLDFVVMMNKELEQKLVLMEDNFRSMEKEICEELLQFVNDELMFEFYSKASNKIQDELCIESYRSKYVPVPIGIIIDEVITNQTHKNRELEYKLEQLYLNFNKMDNEMEELLSMEEEICMDLTEMKNELSTQYDGKINEIQYKINTMEKDICEFLVQIKDELITEYDFVATNMSYGNQSFVDKMQELYFKLSELPVPVYDNITSKDEKIPFEDYVKTMLEFKLNDLYDNVTTTIQLLHSKLDQVNESLNQKSQDQEQKLIVLNDDLSNVADDLCNDFEQIKDLVNTKTECEENDFPSDFNKILEQMTEAWQINLMDNKNDLYDKYNELEENLSIKIERVESEIFQAENNFINKTHVQKVVRDELFIIINSEIQQFGNTFDDERYILTNLSQFLKNVVCEAQNLQNNLINQVCESEDKAGQGNLSESIKPQKALIHNISSNTGLENVLLNLYNNLVIKNMDRKEDLVHAHNNYVSENLKLQEMLPLNYDNASGINFDTQMLYGLYESLTFQNKALKEELVKINESCLNKTQNLENVLLKMYLKIIVYSFKIEEKLLDIYENLTNVGEELKNEIVYVYDNMTQKNEDFYDIQKDHIEEFYNLSSQISELSNKMMKLEEDHAVCKLDPETVQQLHNLTYMRKMVKMSSKEKEQLLLEATMLNNITLINFLVHLDAKPSARGEWGYTPLHWAARRGNLEIAQLLIEAGALVDQTNDNRDTPLHLAVQFGKMDLSRFLLDKGAWVNARNQFRNTPLHIASQKGDLSIARLLVQRGADLSAKNSKGMSPWQDAKFHEKQDVAEWLKKLCATC